MSKVTIPEPDALASDQTLSEEQTKAIQEFKEEPWEKPAEPAKADDKPKAEETPEPEEKEEDKGTQKTPEELEAESKAKEAAAAETTRLEKKAKELGKSVEEIKTLETGEKAEQERLEKVAKEEGKTIDEVKADEANDKKLVERHGNDPVKIARALRKEQSEYGKLKSEIEPLRKLKAQLEDRSLKINEERFNANMEKDRDKIIETYREKNPEEHSDLENLSDDAVFERAKVFIRKAIDARSKVTTDKLHAEAETKRVDLVKNLPEDYKDFIPEIKELLAECGDNQVNDPEFDITYLGNYARGKKYTPAYVKSLEEAAYKRGVEQAKIIPKGGGARPTSGVKTTTTLTESQKSRAKEMYGRREGWSEQQMFDEYAKSDLKDDSKW